MEPGPLPVGSGGHDEGVVENNNSANTWYWRPVKPLVGPTTIRTLAVEN